MAEREEDFGDLSGPGAGKAARGGSARRLLRRGEREARTDCAWHCAPRMRGQFHGASLECLFTLQYNRQMRRLHT